MLIALALVADTTLASAWVLTRPTPEVNRSAALPAAGASQDAVLPRPDPAVESGSARAAAVTALLQRRAVALLARDRDGWLAGIDPASTAFRARQGEVFDHLAEVPLGSWVYDLTAPTDATLTPAAVTRLAGAAPTLVETSLHYTLAGFDTAPTSERQVFTVVRRDGAWLLAGDDESTEADATSREIWDLGPVTVVRAPSVLVLGRPGDLPELRLLATETAAAIPRVTAVWGTEWTQQVVVVVPSTPEEFATLVGPGRDYSQIAAVAKAELVGPVAARTPVGERVLVNPPNFARLNALGRRVVLTHEVTHVATRAATGPGTPTWLVEGFADYVGYLGSGIGVRSAGRELAADVARGDVPTRLPANADFGNANPALPQTYEMGWMACRLLAADGGKATLVKLYRAVGENPSMDSGVALAQALGSVLGTDVATVTVRWQDYLRQQLG